MGLIRLNSNRDGSCIGSAADDKHAHEIEAIFLSAVFTRRHKLTDYFHLLALEIRPDARFLGRVEQINSLSLDLASRVF
jgi:hypothetical protein